MSTEIRVPTLGESVSEATIGRWFKKPGDAVAADDGRCQGQANAEFLVLDRHAVAQVAAVVLLVGVGTVYRRYPDKDVLIGPRFKPFYETDRGADAKTTEVYRHYAPDPTHGADLVEGAFGQGGNLGGILSKTQDNSDDLKRLYEAESDSS